MLAQRPLPERNLGSPDGCLAPEAERVLERRRSMRRTSRVATRVAVTLGPPLPGERERAGFGLERSR